MKLNKQSDFRKSWNLTAYCCMLKKEVSLEGRSFEVLEGRRTGKQQYEYYQLSFSRKERKKDGI